MDDKQFYYWCPDITYSDEVGGVFRFVDQEGKIVDHFNFCPTCGERNPTVEKFRAKVNKAEQEIIRDLLSHIISFCMDIQSIMSEGKCVLLGGNLTRKIIQSGLANKLPGKGTK